MYEETIDMTHLKPEGLQIDRRVIENAWRIQESDWESKGDLTFELFIQGNAQKADIQGGFQAGIIATCHRCLKSYQLDLSRRFHLTYQAADPERFAREEVELSSQELELAYLDGHFLPLYDMLQEQIYLALPMKFLCQPECRGLCVHCGADLNEVECHCPSEQDEDRWAKLKPIGSKTE